MRHERIYSDRGMTGTKYRKRPGLRETLTACLQEDTLVMTRFDSLARSLRDAADTAEELARCQVRLNLGGSVYDPTDPVGRLLFSVLKIAAEFESDVIRARTRERMATAKVRRKLNRRNHRRSAGPETTRSPSCWNCSAWGG